MHLESIWIFSGGWIFSWTPTYLCWCLATGTSSSSLVNVNVLSSQLRMVTRQAASLPATCFLRYSHNLSCFLRFSQVFSDFLRFFSGFLRFSQVVSSFLRYSQIISGILTTFLVCSGFLTRQTPPLVASGLHHVHWQLPLCLPLTLGASARPGESFRCNRSPSGGLPPPKQLLLPCPLASHQERLAAKMDEPHCANCSAPNCDRLCSPSPDCWVEDPPVCQTH